MEKYLDLEGLKHLYGRIKMELDGKQDQLAGQSGQLVGFREDGVSALSITAGDRIKLARSAGGLEIGVDLDRGGVFGDVALLDDILEPGTYTWLDEPGSMGHKGGLWNVVVSRSDYMEAYASVTQTIFGTYAPGVRGRVLTRVFYYANDPNWTAWRELVSMDQITNPNLLDNWYFVNPINQRGAEEYTSEGYTIDRWRINGTGAVKVQRDGIVIQKTPGTPYVIFQSYIEDSRVSAADVVTISAMVNGTLITATGRIELGISTSCFTGNDEDRFECYDLNSLPGIHIIRFVLVSDEPCLVRAVKLEMGSAQSLAHQDEGGRWLLNGPPPDQTQELIKSRRYFKCIGGVDAHFTGYRDYSNARNIVCEIPDVPMRVAPTVILKMKYASNAAVKDNVAYPVNSVSGFSKKLFFFHPSTDIPTRGVVAVHFNDTIWLSADL